VDNHECVDLSTQSLWSVYKNIHQNVALELNSHLHVY
jgi:hypothetical protein